jgi:CHASE2 domain-containing sensor protein
MKKKKKKKEDYYVTGESKLRSGFTKFIIYTLAFVGFIIICLLLFLILSTTIPKTN